MIQFQVSAPGKVILFGEHAVVYEKTAVAASLDLRTTLKFKELSEVEEGIKITFPKVRLALNVPLVHIRNIGNEHLQPEINHEVLRNHIQQFVHSIGYSNLQQRLCLEAFFYILIYVTIKEQINLKPFEMYLDTDVSIGSGLGSSAAFSVCLAACLLHWSHLQRNMHGAFNANDLDVISKYAYEGEKVMHGSPSGIDNSVCTYGSIIEFRKNDYIKQIHNVKSMRILLVDTRVQRNTKVLLEKVVELKQMYPSVVNLILDSIDNISKEAIQVIKSLQELPCTDKANIAEQYKRLMILINMNQSLLATCQVSHPSLDRICAEAQNYAFAAKLTGAGGGGYAYVLLQPDTQPETIASISKKLIADGYIVTLTSLGCNGVKVDN